METHLEKKPLSKEDQEQLFRNQRKAIRDQENCTWEEYQQRKEDSE